MRSLHYFKDHPLRRSIVFIGFSGEEEGLRGSRYFVENPLVPLENIRFLINLDMVASGTKGHHGGCRQRILKQNLHVLSAVGDSLGIGPVGKRPNAPNSDHYFFIERMAFAASFLYTNKGHATLPSSCRRTRDARTGTISMDTYILVRILPASPSISKKTGNSTIPLMNNDKIPHSPHSRRNFLKQSTLGTSLLVVTPAG